jgi:hypothetical protein
MTPIVIKPVALALNPTQIVQWVCVGLCLVAVAVAVNLMLHRDAALGIKVLWIAALLLVIAVAPEKLPFLSVHAGACLFFRNAFGGIFVVLLLLNLFVIFRIQLPKERVPRFDGKVVELVNSGGARIPRVAYQDAASKQHVFDDALSTTIFPQRTFAVGERVAVRAPTTAPPHIDHSAFARWQTAIFLILIAALTFSLSLSYHLHYLSLMSRK